MNSSLVSHADADHWVHVESCQLARLDDGDAHLEVLRLQARRHRVHRRLRPGEKMGKTVRLCPVLAMSQPARKSRDHQRMSFCS